MFNPGQSLRTAVLKSRLASHGVGLYGGGAEELLLQQSLLGYEHLQPSSSEMSRDSSPASVIDCLSPRRRDLKRPAPEQLSPSNLSGQATPSSPLPTTSPLPLMFRAEQALGQLLQDALEDHVKAYNVENPPLLPNFPGDHDLTSALAAIPRPSIPSATNPFAVEATPAGSQSLLDLVQSLLAGNSNPLPAELQPGPPNNAETRAAALSHFLSLEAKAKEHLQMRSLLAQAPRVPYGEAPGKLLIPEAECSSASGPLEGTSPRTFTHTNSDINLCVPLRRDERPNDALVGGASSAVQEILGLSCLEGAPETSRGEEHHANWSERKRRKMVLAELAESGAASPVQGTSAAADGSDQDDLFGEEKQDPNITAKSLVEKKRRGRISTNFAELRKAVNGQGDMASVLLQAASLIHKQKETIERLQQLVIASQVLKGNDHLSLFM